MDLILRSFKKNFQFTCGPCSPMCINAHPCVNYKLIKTQLRVKLNLTKKELKLS